MIHHLKNEYGAPCTLERMPDPFPRWVAGPVAAIRRLGESEDVTLRTGSKHPLVREFRDEWRLRWATEQG